MSFHWEAPLWLGLLPIWVLMGWLVTRIRLSSSHIGEKKRLGWIRAYWTSLGVCLMLLVATLGLAEPIIVFRQPSLHEKALWVVWDVSQSMKEEDVKPNRQTFAREIFYRFLDTLSLRKVELSIGLIVFARSAYAALPPTKDKEALSFMLREVGRMNLGEGTNIAAALNTLLALADAGQEALLVSDGAHNMADSPPLEEYASLLRERKIRLHSLLIGKRGEQFFPQTLQLLSHTSGGNFFENALPCALILEALHYRKKVYRLKDFILPVIISVGFVSLIGMSIGGWFNVLAP
ncbi:MAG: VWA domain-containing protein [Bacteroidia bacterium]|nr:VWA domain-containing protein [Bacteroidia bacterium]MDW8134890.1 VWA domain-containing protein [Bacteroidia bacterium]